MTTEEKIRKQLAENPIILYMKGVPTNPQCGFSGKAVGILTETDIPYSYVNVLEAPFIREKLPSISHWPLRTSTQNRRRRGTNAPLVTLRLLLALVPRKSNSL